MAPVPVFLGRVIVGGILVLDQPADYARYRRRLEGQLVEVVLRKRRSKRSIDQNDYLHAVPFPMIAKETGDDIEGTKFDVMGEWSGWRQVKRSGLWVPNKLHTSERTVEEISELIEWIPPWALRVLNLNIPLPNEVDW